MPSGKSHYFEHDGAIVVFAIAANKNKSNWLLDKPNAVFELARLWAPDGHQAMLTEAISSLAAGARAAN